MYAKLWLMAKLISMKPQGVVALFGGAVMDMLISFVDNNNGPQEPDDIDVACQNIERCNAIAREIKDGLTNAALGWSVDYHEMGGRARRVVVRIRHKGAIFIQIDLCDASNVVTDASGAGGTWHENVSNPTSRDSEIPSVLPDDLRQNIDNEAWMGRRWFLRAGAPRLDVGKIVDNWRKRLLQVNNQLGFDKLRREGKYELRFNISNGTKDDARHPNDAILSDTRCVFPPIS